ncbi:MAG: glycosyltransferase family 2 protein [Nostoc sp. TH1S01]|nr:glycosyltransferase family 2 protein [Nostoc sp. TH1S01]
MTSLEQKYTVSFTTNACVTDNPFIEKTLRSMLHSLNYPFHEKLVALDVGKPVGKYLERQTGEIEELRTKLEQLRTEGIINRVDEVPWDETLQKAVLKKYFGRDDIEVKDFDGAPIYQYLFALEQCTGDYILHVDSDVLFCQELSRKSWIDEGIEMLQANPSVVIATCEGGPPQAKNFIEKLTGRPSKSKPQKLWNKARNVSTRYFLLDRKRLEKIVLPLVQKDIGEPLENSFTHTFKVKGFERWSMTAGTWAIHPVEHGENFIQHLDDLIWAVENNVYPFKRDGKRWNMHTDGDDIKPWLNAISQAKSAMF